MKKKNLESCCMCRMSGFHESCQIQTIHRNFSPGIFAAPVKGLYYFTFFAHGGGEDRIRLVLKKDGAVVVDIHDHPSSADPADNAGNAVFLELEQGNQVYVTILANSAVWAEGFATTFSGVLLSKSWASFFLRLNWFMFIADDDTEKLTPLWFMRMAYHNHFTK